jgi:hypothetical protein
LDAAPIFHGRRIGRPRLGFGSHDDGLFVDQQLSIGAFQFVGQIVPYTQAPELIVDLVHAALPEGYSGDTLTKIPDMVKSAIKKGFHERKPKKSDKGTISAEAVKLVSDSGMGLFHDSQNRGYISQQTPQGGWLHYRLKSEAAEHLMQKAYFEAKGKPLSSQAMRETLGLLEARAIFGGEQHGMALRIGRAGDAVFVDLGRADGQVVRIDRSGWKATYDCAVKFVRPAGFGELPIPQAGGSIEGLKELLQLSAENFTLLLAFIIVCLRPGSGFMCLFVEGQQGSGKSFLCDIVKRIVDPNVASKMRLPDTERDLMVQANSIYLPVFDNASGVKARISDALCMLATGGGFSTRKLFTDDGLAIFNMARPFIINGIGDFAHRPDLLERAVPLQLPALDEGQRKTEEQLLRDFEAMLPGLLGALFGIVASALANEATATPPIGFRMADCAKWLAAAEKAVGFAPGELLSHLSKAQTEFAVDRVMENSITAGLLALLEKGPIEETAKGLLTALVTGGHATGDAFFPKSASRFSSELKRLQPDLKKADILVEFGQRSGNRRPIRVWQKGQEVMTFGPPKVPL